MPTYPSTFFCLLPVGTIFATANRRTGCRFVKTHSAEQTVNGIGLARVFRAEKGGVGLPFAIDADQYVWQEGNVPPGF